uniref:Uncharacterized protein n=1 Tax=Globisporangium ultimum (strain ATCC 200006 / CBS 805.95 / DAOM BR144) TaxID=431595 RepID=K3WBU0_GLOUD
MAPKDMTIESYNELQQHAGASPTCTVATGCKAATAKKKRVRWSTITIHEFGVALGGSSVPTKGGPAIGLTDAPEFTWTTKVGEMAERSEGGVHKFSSEERVRLLQAAGESDGMILRFSRETNIILTSRRRTLVENLEERRRDKQEKKRKAATERPTCASFLSARPRMIPANYV